MSLKDQFTKISNLVRFRQALILPPEAEVPAETWTPKAVYLKSGQVVQIKCLASKRSALAKATPVAIIRMKDVRSSSFIQNYKE
jgi:hypothetical protein